ncbi:MAG TPA: DUF2784 domain-containing protein [Candidatus Hydrogenedens sp.]|mgnify:CR=1 FL=1|nr:DUF2784 domain-containing protein [Candidatus Hydrogenedens sp.]
MFWLKIIDICLTVLHISLILFFILGWIYKRTRKVHYLLVIIIAISWFVLGLFYGFGYCFLTDIHWRVKMLLNEENLPISFIKYVLDKMTGKDFNEVWVDYITLAVFVCVLIISTSLYIRDNRKKNKE